ncbi:DNA-binding transcriptional regulator, CsgD family [Rhizobium sp. NFR03]|nr:DNA-binding transcriptional regulator, CsgD family [Rhizobium sp. NFR03]
MGHPMDSDDADLIGRIYTASLVPEKWVAVIDSLSNRLRGRGGSLFTLSDGELSWDAPAAIRAIMEDYVAGGWDKKNPRLAGLLARAHPGFLQDSDVAEGDYERLPIVTEFLRPRDIFHTAATVIKGAHEDLAVFSVDRGQASGNFTPGDLGWLDGIRPHLARAVALTSRLKMRQAATATAALAMVGIPAAILRRNHTVLSANALFEDLAGTVFIASAFGRLALTDVRANRSLKQALADNRQASSTVRSIPIGNGAGIVGVLHAIPACYHARDILGEGGTLLVLAQPKDSSVIDPEWLHWLYDLSPTEADVATRLARGVTVEGIAAARGTSIASVRTHVKSLLRKTGLTRQSDFIRSVTSLAAIAPAMLSRQAG